MYQYVFFSFLHIFIVKSSEKSMLVRFIMEDKPTCVRLSLQEILQAPFYNAMKNSDLFSITYPSILTYEFNKCFIFSLSLANG